MCEVITHKQTVIYLLDTGRPKNSDMQIQQCLFIYSKDAVQE
jgi:hypothetical protein